MKSIYHHQQKLKANTRLSLHENCPYSELFCSVFSRIWTEYGEIRSISPCSVQIRENTDQKNFECGHFAPNAYL